MASPKVKGSIAEVTKVQVDGLVALKIIKHCQEEGSSTDHVQGFLVGLVVDDTLEVTNCFPLPKSLNDPQAEQKYQTDILENLRKVNCDYYVVGWYQSTYLRSHFTKEFFESQIPYQTKIEESVVIVYDPFTTTVGNLTLQSFRLTQKLLDLVIKDNQFTPESVRESSLKHTDMFEELPVILRNSHLVNALLCEMNNNTSSSPKMDFLNLSMNREVVNHMRLLIDSVEALQQETYKLLGYERNSTKQIQLKQQFIAKRKEENSHLEPGKEPLPIDDKSVEKELNLKPVHPPPRNIALLTIQQVDTQCERIKQVAGQTFPKLYLSEALQQKD